jgi:biotin operon repressor
VLIPVHFAHLVASIALALAPQAADVPAEFSWAHEGDYGVAPVYSDAGTPAFLGDDTLGVEETIYEGALRANLDGAPLLASLAPPAMTLDSRGFTVPNPGFELARTVDEALLEPSDVPVELFVGASGVDVGWHLPLVGAVGVEDREAGEHSLDYSAAEDAGVPVWADDHELGPEAEVGSDSDTAIGSLDATGQVVCVWAASQDIVGATAPDSAGRCPAGFAATWRALTPNIVLHSVVLGEMVVGLVEPVRGLVDGGIAAPGGPGLAFAAPAPTEGAARLDDGPLLRDGGAALPQPTLAAPGSSATGAQGAGAAPAPVSSPAATLGLQALTGAVLAALLIPLYRRLVQGRVLHHDVRERLLGVVHANPGIHESAAAKALGIGPNLAQYHVRLLAEFGLLEVRRFGGRKCLFPAGQMGRAEKMLAAAEQGAAGRVVDLVANQPGIAQRDLARLLGIGESSVKWHLDRLEVSGIVVVERAPDGKRVRLTPDAAVARTAAQAAASQVTPAAGALNAPPEPALPSAAEPVTSEA